jgi:hypothetical protein
MIVFNQTSLHQYNVSDLSLENDKYIGQIDKDEEGWWFVPDDFTYYNSEDLLIIGNKLKELDAIPNTELDTRQV